MSQSPRPQTSRHTLLALCGTSPAVLTETVWALAEEVADHPGEAELPDRLIVLTTTAGREAICEQLLQPADEGQAPIWQQLITSLEQRGYPTAGKLRFGDTSEHIRCFNMDDPHTGLATPIEDLRSTEEQRQASDFMLETLASLSSNPGEKLTVSIAGGRKTMSALLYGCMTLVGRKEDRITHVLVSPPYESTGLYPRFYFPQQAGRKLRLLRKPDSTDFAAPDDDLVFPSDEAEIELADIPFVPIRYAFPDQIGQAPNSFSQLTAIYTGLALEKSELPGLRLATEDGQLTLHIGTTELPIQAAHSGLIHFLIQRAANEEPAFPDQANAIGHYNDHLRALQQSAPAGAPRHWKHSAYSGAKIDEDALRRRLSSLRKKLREACPFGDELAARLPTKGRFSLDYPPHLIEL